MATTIRSGGHRSFSLYNSGMANEGLAPPDYTTGVGQVRLLLGDTDATTLDNDDDQGEYGYFSDKELEALLILYGQNVKRTAARALRTIAHSQALLLKKFNSADVAVDGVSLATSLLKLADSFDKEADSDTSEDGLDGSGGVFMIVPTAGIQRAYGLNDRIDAYNC